MALNFTAGDATKVRTQKGQEVGSKEEARGFVHGEGRRNNKFLHPEPLPGGT